MRLGRLAVVGTIIAVATTALVATASVGPISPAWDGVTLCYPIVGAVQRFDPALPDSTRLRIQAHENVHRDDCERRGAVVNYLRLATTGGRLEAEARAECAEARQQMAIGRDAWFEHERVIDELHYGYPWFRRLPEKQLRVVIGRVCPDLAMAGAIPPWSRNRN